MAGKRDSKAAKRQDSTQSTKPGLVVNMDVDGDKDDGPGSLRCVGGSRSKTLNAALATQAAHTLWLPPATPDADRDKLIQAALFALMEFKPRDGIEGMMATQAVGLHSAVMECLRRAMLPEQSGEVATKLRQQAANLSRTFLDIVAALDRKRGKGMQVVRVERVQVAAGGQAIVGTIQAGATHAGQHGGGHDAASQEEPHALPAKRTRTGKTPPQLAHNAAFGPILPPVRGADTGRDALPVASDGQRTVPDARRG